MGKEETKARIIAAAAELFAQASFESVSVRQIGASAGVDPALVNHHFGGKEALFEAVVASALGDNLARLDLDSIDVDDLGGELVRFVDELWLSPANAGLTAMVRRALATKTEILQSFITSHLVELIASRLPGEDARLRAVLAGSQIGGLVLARHILKIPDLCTLSTQELVDYVGPRVQRDLTGDLTEGMVSPAN